MEELKVPKAFLADAIHTAVHKNDRNTFSSFPSRKVPHELFHQWKLDIGDLHISCTPCWYNIKNLVEEKPGNKAQQGMLVGESKNHKAYNLFDCGLQKSVVSKDTLFHQWKALN